MLRNRQRRYRGTGSVGDELALLQSRMRSGSLPEGSPIAAAYAGYEPARLCLPDAPEPSDNFVTWACVLTGFGREGFVRAALAACLVHHKPRGKSARAALEAAEAWTACPCEAHAQAARAAGRSRSPGPAQDTALAAGTEALSVAANHAVHAIVPWVPARSLESDWGPLHYVPTQRQRNAESGIREAIQREIGRWLLQSAWQGADGEAGRLAADVTHEHRRAVSAVEGGGAHDPLLALPDAERRQVLRYTLDRVLGLRPDGLAGWPPIQQLSDLAARLIREVHPWAADELSELLTALDVEFKSGLPVSELLRAAAGLGEAEGLSPALDEALRLHVIPLPGGGWLGPGGPGLIQRVGRLLARGPAESH